MPTSDGPSRFPVFVAPSHGNHRRCPGYVAPVRSPPPAKAPPPPPLKPGGPPRQQQIAPSLPEDNRRRPLAQSRQQRKNTIICCGVSLGAFLLTLILVLSLKSGNVLYGLYDRWLLQMFSFFHIILHVTCRLFIYLLFFCACAVFSICFACDFYFILFGIILLKS